MLMKKYVRILEKHMSSLYPNLNIHFYVSRKQKYVHMGLDQPLFTLRDSDKTIAQIRDFTYDELDERFTFCFPQLVSTVKWKFDYIIFKREATKNSLYV